MRINPFIYGALVLVVFFGMVHSASINFLTNRVRQKASFWSEIGKKLDFNSKTLFLRSFSKYGCSLAAKSVKDFLASYVAKMNHAETRIEQQRIRTALQALTPDQRQVIMLRYFEDYGNEEVAQTIQKPLGAVKALHHRAIYTLRRILLREEDTTKKSRDPVEMRTSEEGGYGDKS